MEQERKIHNCTSYEFFRDVANRTGVPIVKAKEIYDEIVDTALDSIEEGVSFRFDRIGKVVLRIQKEKEVANFKTKKRIKMPEHCSARMKINSEIKESALEAFDAVKELEESNKK